MPTVDDYMAAQPAPARAVLDRVRTVILRALPGATERISYQIPVFERDGVVVVYLAGFVDHYSIYPASARLLAALGEDAVGHLHGKATLRFAYGDAVPKKLITRITKLRALEAAERTARKAVTKKAVMSKAAATKPPVAGKGQTKKAATAKALVSKATRAKPR